MSIATKRIFYLYRLAHRVFAEIMRERSDVSLHALVNFRDETSAFWSPRAARCRSSIFSHKSRFFTYPPFLFFWATSYHARVLSRPSTVEAAPEKRTPLLNRLLDRYAYAGPSPP